MGSDKRIKEKSSLFESLPPLPKDESGRSPAEKYMVDNNVIPRTKYTEDSAERAPITESGVFESHAQGSKPQVFEHTTESENDWDEEVIEVVKEIFHDNEPAESSSKEKFRNLLDDVSDQATHVHEGVE